MVQLPHVYRVKHITWRGSVRSCNYTCAYCPFAKRRSSRRELERDREERERFLRWLGESGFSGSVLLAPYGEGLIHPAYQEYYGRLSRIPGVAMVSCQTNLSWDPALFLTGLEERDADFDRLALWATFHPAMTEPGPFLQKCEILARRIRLCVGMVGDPGSLAAMEALKSALPEGVGFWINAMDGLGRRYTPGEMAALTALDPLFSLELERFPSDGRCCGRFVDGRGGVSPCNRARPAGNLLDGDLREQGPCTGICDCFLAYSNRKDVPRLLRLGPYPQLRLAWRPPRALFLDLDGSAAPGGTVPAEHRERLEALSRRYRVYAMTSRSRESALRLLRGGVYLSGGVFAAGADTVDFHQGRGRVIPLPEMVEGARATCRVTGIPVKQLFYRRPDIPPGCRVFREGSYGVVSARAGKLGGVRTLQAWNRWADEGVLVYGNGAEDVAPLRAYPYSAAPPDASPEALGAARFHLDFPALADMLLP